MNGHYSLQGLSGDRIMPPSVTIYMKSAKYKRQHEGETHRGQKRARTKALRVKKSELRLLHDRTPRCYRSRVSEARGVFVDAHGIANSKELV